MSNVPWEHKVLRLAMPLTDEAERTIEKRLNEAGELGWELVSVTFAAVPGQMAMLHAYLKRRIL